MLLIFFFLIRSFDHFVIDGTASGTHFGLQCSTNAFNKRLFNETVFFSLGIFDFFRVSLDAGRKVSMRCGKWNCASTTTFD